MKNYPACKELFFVRIQAWFNAELITRRMFGIWVLKRHLLSLGLANNNGAGQPEGAQRLSGRVLDSKLRAAGLSLTGVTVLCP